ncbi:MAG: hypothetical protein AAGF97_16205 [Planctomycetota bacterium]
MLIKGLLGLLAAVGAFSLIAFGVKSILRYLRRNQLLAGKDIFHRRREWLEAEFLSRATKCGKPRGLEWVNCDFDDDVTFARDRHSGELRALVGVTISFQAIPGGGMEDVEAVGNLRAATAVFRFDRRHWETEGRAIFNLSPHETIRHFGHELEPVEASG